MLTTSELLAMQNESARFMPDIASISRPTAVSDGMGGETRTFTSGSLSGSAACRVDQVSGYHAVVRLLGDRISGRELYVISFPYGTDVRIDDHIIVGGQTYQVMATITGSWEIVEQAAAVKI